MARYELNDDLNGVEVYFDSKPDEPIRNEMKAIHYRWHKDKRCWYAKQNEDTIALAKRVCGEGKEAEAKPIMKGHCCYSNSVPAFLKETESDFISTMRDAFNDEYLFALGKEQVEAWKDCFKVMQSTPMHDCAGIIFEYALPYESGRRPDVLLVTKEHVVILEFKMKNRILEADVDQVAAYARDIREYHFESREKSVVPVLVLTRASDIDKIINNVRCVSADNLLIIINDCTKDDTKTDIKAWMDSKYEPLPTIVESARNFMDHAELPNIRRVNSTCIPKTLDSLRTLTIYAKKTKKHTIAFVTGVPGAGKTYLGLQYVYDIREKDGQANSVYLSGNGALVKVLTNALNSSVFVKDLHKVENAFLSNGSPDFNSNVIVFDEGQRAWDIKQMRDKRHVDFSEPDVMIQLAEKCLDWCVLLILVGEGQEIYHGENSGISQWNTAINKGKKDWEVVYPSKLKKIFVNQRMVNGIDYDVFDLTVSLRSHLAGDVSCFVNHIIDGEINKAAGLADSIYDAGYNMYFTRDLNAAKEYCKERYKNNINKRYGMITSHMAKELENYGIGPADGTTDVAGWFNADPNNPSSCCALTAAISEFKCQGLEIDMPIIGWGRDLQWSGNRWKPNGVREGTDDYDYRINSYRVLLTRGRDGFIIFVPPGLDNAANVFKKAGIRELLKE